MLIPLCQNGYLAGGNTGKTKLGCSKQGFLHTLLSPLLPGHPLPSYAQSPGNWDSWYPSNFPNSCMLTLSPSCAFVRTFDFLYKTDEEETAKVLCIVSLKVHCVCSFMCVSLSQGELLGESQISLMSLEVMQNSCVFTCSWVKPGAQAGRGKVGRVGCL